MTTAPSRPSAPAGPRPARDLVRPTLVAAAVAALGVAAVHLLFDALGADFVVAPGGQPETVVSAGQAAAPMPAAALAGGVLAALLARVTARPARWFTGVVAGAVVLMAANPLLAADQALTVVALELEHLVVAGAALALLRPALRR
jgi:hypothetical protein